MSPWKMYAVVALILCGIALIIKGVYINRRIKIQATKYGQVPQDNIHYLDGKIQPFIGTAVTIIAILIWIFA